MIRSTAAGAARMSRDLLRSDGLGVFFFTPGQAVAQQRTPGSHRLTIPHYLPLAYLFKIGGGGGSMGSCRRSSSMITSMARLS